MTRKEFIKNLTAIGFGSPFMASLLTSCGKENIKLLGEYDNGFDGLKAVNELKPDAITLDILMPQMDGWAVLAALKEDPLLEAIPVAMLSAGKCRRK